MPSVQEIRSRLAGTILVCLTALMVAGGLSSRAAAQTFIWTPTNQFSNVSGGVLFSTLTITANAAGGNLFLGLPDRDQYNITNISGTFNGNPITGLLTPATVGSLTVNNAYNTNSPGGAGAVFVGRDDANSHLSNGFGFTTSAGSFLVCDFDCILGDGFGTNSLYVFDASGQMSGSVGTFFSTLQPVPGPLAGAGMLSWLAVLLMGLLRWRERIRARLPTWNRATS